MHLLSVKLSLNCSVLFFKNQFLRNVSQSLINNIIKKEDSFTKKKKNTTLEDLIMDKKEFSYSSIKIQSSKGLSNVRHRTA